MKPNRKTLLKVGFVICILFFMGCLMYNAKKESIYIDKIGVVVKDFNKQISEEGMATQIAIKNVYDDLNHLGIQKEDIVEFQFPKEVLRRGDISKVELKVTKSDVMPDNFLNISLTKGDAIYGVESEMLVEAISK